MPTYQYRCQACRNELEAFQKFTDDALTTCPECGGSLRKVFNAVGIVFKGSGFYATDSRKSSKAAASLNGSSSESKSTSESTSTETKSAGEAASPKKDTAAA